MVFGQVRIDEMFAFVIVDDDGTEGIPAVLLPNGMMSPMVGADMDRVSSLMPAAKKAASRKGRAVELVKFSTRTHVRTIEPGKGAIRRPVPTLDDQVKRVAPAHHSEKVRMFDEPMLVKGARMSGVVVSPATVDGEPAVGLVFLDEVGEELPPIVVTGRTARDLGPLCADAYEKAKPPSN